MKNTFQRMVITLLVVAMFFGLVNQRVLANDLAANDSQIIEEKSIESAEIVGEVREKREANVKHFRLSNGLNQMVVYPEEVHVLKEGEWKDIDHRLSDSETFSKQAGLVNQESSFRVTFAKNGESKELVSIDSDFGSLSWRFVDQKSAQISAVSPIDERMEKTKVHAFNTIIYPELFFGVDVEYQLSGLSLKENIWIKHPQSTRVFSQVFTFGGLIPRLNKDGSVDLLNKAEEVSLKFEAPYLVDAVGEVSRDVAVSMSLTPVGWMLTMQPSSKWMDDPNRQWPILLDPTVTTPVTASSIEDVHVSSGYPTSNYANSYILKTGYGTSSKINRTYMKFTLPSLSSADLVVDARLNMSIDPVGNSQLDYQVNAHRVSTNWNESTMTWNTKAPFDPIILDYTWVGKDANPLAYGWEITPLVKDWYQKGDNFGVMLKDAQETAAYKEYYSANTSGSYINYRPMVMITYISNSGIEPYWDFQTFDTLRNGSGFVNTYNGHLVITRQITGTTGSRMPASIGLVYNLNDRHVNLGFGFGWRLNISQKAGLANFGQIAYTTWVDSDGTTHYFRQVDNQNKYVDEAGSQCWMTYSATTGYTLHDSAGNKSTFNTQGWLTKMEDRQGNALTIALDAQGKPTKVTDGIGRETTFSYNASNLLTSIEDPSDRLTSFTITSNQLRSITDPDSVVSNITYASSVDHRVMETSVSGHPTIKLEYTSVLPLRIKKVSQWSGTDEGLSISLSYGNQTTLLTDREGKTQRLIFDNYGRATSLQDDGGYGLYMGYQSGGSTHNALTLASKVQRTIVNEVSNHGMEKDSVWTFNKTLDSSATSSYSTAQKMHGLRSLLISKSVSSGKVFQQQILTLTKEKLYTLSGWLKTSGISGSPTQGAFLSVIMKNSAGADVEVASSMITTVSDWQRLEASFTIPSNASSNQVIVRLNLGCAGTVYFDSIQLEAGAIANRYNLVENGHFGFGETYWGKSGGADANDTVVSLTSQPNHLDPKAFRIQGVASANKQAWQFINQPGQQGDVYVMSGWAMSQSVPLRELEGLDRHVSLYFRFDGTDGQLYYQRAEFNNDSSDWQFLSAVVSAPVDYSRICIILHYKYNVNTVYFDGIGIYKEAFGQTFQYDSQGNLISVTDLAKQSSTFQYNGNNDLIKAIDPKSSEFTYEYDIKRNLIKAVSATGTETTFTYDNYGNSLSAQLKKGTLTMRSNLSMDSFGNMVSSVSDALGNSVSYDYHSTKGTLTSMTNAEGSTTNYTYHNLNDRLLSVSASKGSSTVVNEYGYLNDQLKTIVHNGFHISFTNNGFQQLTSIDLLHPTNPLLKRNLMSRSYDPITQRLLSQTYGNGHTVSYDVDDQNRVIAIRHQGVVKTTFDYDANGLLGRLVEVDRGVTIRYIYDFANRLVSMVSSEGVSTRYHYDANNQVSSITDSVGSSNRTTSYTFDDDNRLTQLTTPANRIRSYTLDGLGRLTSSTINTTTPLLSSYTYQPHPSDPTLTSVRLASVTHGSLPSIHYTYDANGNIVSVQQGSATIQYIYNELNEVIRENNQRDQVTWVYEYDLGGNIVAKKEYPYTTGSLSTPLRVIPYVYGDAVWKDLLTSYDGQAISSDTIGNPLIMGNRTFTWQKGRQLAALNIGGTNVQYSYNHAGIRTSKLVNGVTTTYRLRGDVVLEETTGSSTIRYGYDPNNQLISIEYGGVEYGVLRNAQNDVMALVNPSGSIVVQYAYSTWGEVVSISGSMASTLGAANPYRYRGYRFDTESGYYYLQSRYYDPQIGRFINADEFVSTGLGFTGFNMFAYCGNNPVSRIDPSGMLWEHIIEHMSRIIGVEYTVVKQDSVSIDHSPVPFIISFEQGSSKKETISKRGSSSNFMTLYVEERADNPWHSSAGLRFKISSATLEMSFGIENTGTSLSIKREEYTSTIGLKADITKFKVGIEKSETFDIDTSGSLTNHTSISISGVVVMMILVYKFTGQMVPFTVWEY